MTNKSDEMMDFLDSISKKHRGRSLSDAWKKDICVWCGKKATQFKDFLSEREYTISGFCQECQDKVFDEILDEVFDES